MMYDLILELPLFKGLNHEQFTKIIEKVPFVFKKFHSNECIARAGDSCDKLLFLLSGRVRVASPTYSDRILIFEEFDAPYSLPTYYLFGRETTMQSTIYADGPAGMMMIEKSNFLDLIGDNRVLLVNVLNILSTAAQGQHLAMDCLGESSPQIRLASWLFAYTTRNAKNIMVVGEQKDWCDLFSCDEETFLSAINVLVDEKLMEYDRGKLNLTDRYGLRLFLSKNMARK